jgi:hypothetical protein
MDKPKALSESKKTLAKFQCRDIPGLQDPKQVLQQVTFDADRRCAQQQQQESLLVHMVQKI